MSTMLATTARIVHRLIARNGLDADALFIECGLDPLKLQDSRARYPLERIRALWHLTDERIGSLCWALEAGEEWRATDFHAIGYAFLASRTLESALLRFERYIRIVIQDALLRISCDPASLVVSFGIPSADADIGAMHDARLAVVLRMCREAYGQDLPLNEVRLAHPWRACGYERHFGCPVRYDADCSGLVFPIDAVHRTLPTMNRELALANDRIVADFDRSLTDLSIVGRVRRAVMDRLSAGKPSAKDVARSLALAPRTLQRKLQEEGTTFREVADEVRKELALQYVESGEYDLSVVTYLTGFATLSAFSRAYKGWTGRNPSEDRGRG